MNEMNTYSFVCEKDGGRNTISHAYMCDRDSTWMPIMMQFAAFLEGCGYIGVVDRVTEMIDQEFEDYWK
jgi:hypothetical protein